MNIPKIVEKFETFIKEEAIVAIGTSEYAAEFIDELVKILLTRNKKVFFVATTAKQATQLYNLGQQLVSLSEKEIDVAIEFADQIDTYNNFIKKDTRSFIRDKMIAQSALNLIVVSKYQEIVDNIEKDIYVEISSFAWERTILNLQSYGLARVVKDTDDNFIKTETGHYLARITLDKNISLDDFEFSVKNIPGVLESGVFIGLADIFFVIDPHENIIIKTTSQIKLWFFVRYILPKKVPGKKRQILHLGNVGEDGAARSKRLAERFPNFDFHGIDLKHIKNPDYTHSAAEKEKSLRAIKFSGLEEGKPKNLNQIQAEFREGLTCFPDNYLDIITSDFSVGFYKKQHRHAEIKKTADAADKIGSQYANIGSEKYTKEIIELVYKKLKPKGKFIAYYFMDKQHKSNYFKRNLELGLEHSGFKYKTEEVNISKIPSQYRSFYTLFFRKDKIYRIIAIKE